MAKIKFLQAAPNETSGMNLNTPIRKFDTHPNQYFEVGDRVMPLDWEEPPVTGEVIGHVTEDRLIIDWGRIVSQEDIDDLVKMDDYVGQTARSRVPTRHGSVQSRMALGPAQNWYQDSTPQTSIPKPPTQPRTPQVNPGGQVPNPAPAPVVNQGAVQNPARIHKQFAGYYKNQKGQGYNPLLVPAIQGVLEQAGVHREDIADLADYLGALLKNTPGWQPGMRHAASPYARIPGTAAYSAPGSKTYEQNQAHINRHQEKYGSEYNPLMVKGIQVVLEKAGLNSRTIRHLAEHFGKMIAAYTDKTKQPWKPGVDTGGYLQMPSQSQPQVGDQQAQPVLNPAAQTVQDPSVQDPIDVALVHYLQEITPEFLTSLQDEAKEQMLVWLRQLKRDAPTMTPQARSAAVQELIRVADLTEQSGAPEAAESFRAAAVISKSVSDLYSVPETREASRDSRARSALLGARDLVLQATDSLRNTQVPAFRVAADLAELHFAASALYPNHD